MALCCQVDHCIEIFFFKQLIDCGSISNVYFNKAIIWLVFNIL